MTSFFIALAVYPKKNILPNTSDYLGVTIISY